MSKSSPSARTVTQVWHSAATSCDKLEYIVPDAIAGNADTLVSIGGVQSNHTRMVAAVSAKIGHEVPPDPGKLGAARRRRLRPGRQHSAVAYHGRPYAAGGRGLRHRHPRELEEGAGRREG